MESTDLRPLPTRLHIVLGDSALGTLQRAYIAGGLFLVDQDVLSCGPTPSCTSLMEWTSTRNAYWKSVVPDGDSGHTPSLCNLIDNVDRLRDAENICIWAATSLTEQLFIAHVIHLVEFAGADPKRISVVQFETLPGREGRVVGLGELHEKDMSKHPPPKPLSNEALIDYRFAWRALTSADPELLERFASERPAANAWLKNALQLMLRRYPDVRTGLPSWDFALLKCVREHGPRAAKLIGYALREFWDDGDIVGDWNLFGRLLRLGDERLPKPLLTLTGNRTSMRELDVTLTPFGEDVLKGITSNYPTNPIDDWVGGVRLSSAKRTLWFNDGGRLVR